MWVITRGQMTVYVFANTKKEARRKAKIHTFLCSEKGLIKIRKNKIKTKTWRE